MSAKALIPRRFSTLLIVVMMLSVLIGSAAFPTSAHAASITVTTFADNATQNGQCSLREAITNANDDDATHADCPAGNGADTISFSDALGTATITLTSVLPNISDVDGLTINGSGDITVSGNNLYQVFYVNQNVPLTLDSLIVVNGNGWFGGGILNLGILTITNNTFSGNSSNKGGGVLNIGSLNIANSTFFNNNSGDGAGVLNEGSLNITNSTFSNNSANSCGGGVLNYNILTITNSTFSGNSAPSGGGVYNTHRNNTNGDLTIMESIFFGNNAIDGGGISNYANLTITNSAFSKNSATSNYPSGGGVYNAGSLNITNSSFSDNDALYGGGIRNFGQLTIKNSTFSGNSANEWGGGIDNNTDLTLTISNSTFTGNSAKYGGGLSNYKGSLYLTNSTFTENSAIDGGGVSNNGALAITNSTFSGNNATESGGGVDNSLFADLIITNSTFSGNSATMGGGVHNEWELIIRNSILANSLNGGDCRGAATGTSINNLIEATGNNACGLTHGANGNIIGIDPNLGTLTGSPAYFPINSGSLAIDAGDDATCAASPVNNTSQNGVIRPHGAHCDIGSFEYNGPSISYTISGNTWESGVTLSYIDGTPKTVISDGSGNYSLTVTYDWSGTVTPSKAGYTFSPASITYSNVMSNQIGQNYTALPGGSTISGNTWESGVTLSYIDSTPKIVISDSVGNYSLTVTNNWSGTVTPSKTGYTFNPASITYSNVLADQTGQNYVAPPITYTISGNAWESGVTLSYTDGTPKTAISDSSGNYSLSVTYRWSGTVTPSKAGYTFTPASLTYTNVLADQTGHNYVAPPITFTISGNVGVAGATLSYTDGTPKTAISDSSGNYSLTVTYNWSGAVTPSKAGYAFSPENRTYTNVVENQTAQNYTAVVVTFTDVSNSYWAWSWIERLYNAGITTGCGTNPLIYCPEQSVTRAQMAIFLERGMRGSTYTPPPGTGTVFADVPLSYWAVNWVEKLFADGITVGCNISPLLYCPDDSVTRAQMAKFLLKAEHGASYTPPAVGGSTGFNDVSTSYWASAWIKQLAAEGITTGCGSGNYCPEDPVTRAQMAVFLVRTFNLP